MKALLIASTALAAASAGTIAELSEYLEPEIRAGTYVRILDLHGDGGSDTLYTVSLLGRPLPDSIGVYDPWFDAPVAPGGEDLALLFAEQSTGRRFVVHDSLFFSSPIWSGQQMLPLRIVRRGTEAYQYWAVAAEGLEGDGVALGTEEGAEALVFLRNGREPAVHWPHELP
jgi:hypothetical protein